MLIRIGKKYVCVFKWGYVSWFPASCQRQPPGGARVSFRMRSRQLAQKWLKISCNSLVLIMWKFVQVLLGTEKFCFGLTTFLDGGEGGVNCSLFSDSWLFRRFIDRERGMKWRKEEIGGSNNARLVFSPLVFL